MNIAIYGTGEWGNKLYHYLRLFRDIEITCFVQSSKETDTFNGVKVIDAREIDVNDFDFLVISSEKYFDDITSYLMSLPFYNELSLKIRHVAEWLIDIGNNTVNMDVPLQSVSVDGGAVYIARSKDFVIPLHMYFWEETWSKKEIETFLYLTNKFYGNQANKYFLDIGANIGTTSIYVRMNKKIPVIGFEAGHDNYDIFRINCIINHVEDIIVENMGLSDEQSDAKYMYIPTNSGGGGVIGQSNIEDINSSNNHYENIKLYRLDDYICNKELLKKIGYIWLDTEGHEANIIHGALNTLLAERVPMWLEFNPATYKLQGVWERFISDISSIYDYFIDFNEIRDGQEISREISEISEYPDIMEAGNIRATDIFLY